ncbi:MAG: cytochrome c family protein [Alphaproteobacteria bacterium]|nr:cytochrome c family protein [Alphaproteobacteria bacterium]
MDSFEFNKIAAAVLSALLLMFGTPILAEILAGGGGHDGHEVKVGYKLPVEVASADPGAATPEPAGFDFTKVVAVAADVTPENGQNVFKKCASCHTVNEGGRNGIGPNLYDVVGRGRGNTEGFSYSKALTEMGGVWDYPSMAEFLHNPKGYVKGTKMAFAGLKSEKDIAAVLKYLGTLSASPKPLPNPQ